MDEKIFLVAKYFGECEPTIVPGECFGIRSGPVRSVDRIQHLATAPDGGLKFDKGTEYAALQPPLGRLGKEALAGIDPLGRGGEEDVTRGCGGR